MKLFSNFIIFTILLLFSCFGMADTECRNYEFLGFKAETHPDIDGALQEIHNGDCFLCSEKTEVITTPEECLKCPQRQMEDDKCVLLPCGPDEFRNRSYNSDKCYSCSDKQAVLSTEEECNKCPNRKIMGTNRYCVLSDCEEGEFQNLNGNCIPCSSESATKASPEECSKCPEREFENGNCKIPTECSADEIRSSNGNCVACDTRVYIDTTFEECSKCSERFWGQDGKCHPCESNNWKQIGEKTTPEECARCSNRTMYGEYCALTECEARYEDTYPMFRDYTGTCFSCSDKGAYTTTSEECDQCSNRVMIGNKCVTECADNEFRLLNGNCLACDQDHRSVRRRDGRVSGGVDWYPKASPDECSKCPQREMRDDLCFLKE